MSVPYPKFKAAACHVAPVFLDSAASAEKAVALIGEAARAGAGLVVFPEGYMPGFPSGRPCARRSTTTTCSSAWPRNPCASTGRRSASCATPPGATASSSPSASAKAPRRAWAACGTPTC